MKTSESFHSGRRIIIEPSALRQLAEIVGGEIADHEETVIRHYGQDGSYELELHPDGWVSIHGSLRRRNGHHHGELREALRAAGYRCWA